MTVARTCFMLGLMTALCGYAQLTLFGQLTVTPLLSTDSGRTIKPDFLGVNTRAKLSDLWENTHDPVSLERLGVQHLRFPGGTVANYYDWTTGDMITPDSPHPHHNTSAENYHVDQLLTAYQTTGVQPVFVLNLATSHRIEGYSSALQSQLAMLRYAQQIGLPIERIELGNEFYAAVYDTSTYPLNEVQMQGFLDAGNYYTTASSWAQQIKAEFPSAQIALVDTVVRSIDVTNQNRKYFWNRDLNAGDLSAVDALIQHYYTDAGLLDPQNTSGSLAEIQQQQWKAFLAPNGPDIVIGNAFSFMEDVEKNTQHSNGMPLWITEFNLMDKVGPVARTWTSALFSAAMLYEMLENTSVDLITSHSFNGHKYGAVFYEQDEFPYMQIDPGYSLITNVGDFSANGHLLAMVNQAFDSMDQFARIDFENVPLVGELDPHVASHPALIGYLLQNEQEQRILVTNFSSQELVIDMNTTPGNWKQGSILTADPRRHILSEDDLIRSQSSIADQLTLPAYSVAIVTVPEPAGFFLCSGGIFLCALMFLSHRKMSHGQLIREKILDRPSHPTHNRATVALLKGIHALKIASCDARS